MRWKGRRQSSRVEDRRGRGPVGKGVGIGGGGLLLVVLYVLLTGKDPQPVVDVIQQTRAGGPAASLPADAGAGGPVSDELGQFASVVLADTEDTWNDLFANAGQQYREPNLVLFSGRVQSACGFASAAVGPFYCPGDGKVYIDLAFFDQLSRRFGAPGDFAQAYVIAHEVGHHVQNLLGVSDYVRDRQRPHVPGPGQRAVRPTRAAGGLPGRRLGPPPATAQPARGGRYRGGHGRRLGGRRRQHAAAGHRHHPARVLDPWLGAAAAGVVPARARERRSRCLRHLLGLKVLLVVNPRTYPKALHPRWRRCAPCDIATAMSQSRALPARRIASGYAPGFTTSSTGARLVGDEMARAGWALLLAAVLAACGEPETAPGPSLSPGARPDIVAMLRDDLKAVRHPADGGGTARLEPDPEGLDRVAAGEPGRWTILYEAGELGIAEGGWLFFQVPPHWGWSDPQAVSVEAPGYTEVTTDARAAWSWSRRPWTGSAGHPRRRPRDDRRRAGADRLRRRSGRRPRRSLRRAPLALLDRRRRRRRRDSRSAGGTRPRSRSSPVRRPVWRCTCRAWRGRARRCA